MQQSLFNQEGIAEIRQLGGACGGVLLDWLGHGYYAAKSFSNDRPYTLLSEWLCADIASCLGLPVPARQVIPYKEQKWLGFEWRGDGKSFSPGMEAKLLNHEEVGAMLAFDVFICNRDRHGGNMVFQHPSPGSDSYVCYLIDHSHALVGDFANFQALRQFIQNSCDPAPFLQVCPSQLRGLVRSPGDFMIWLAKIKLLDRRVFESSLARLPSEWKPNPDDTGLLIDFLIERKNTVRELLRSGQSWFPSLGRS